MRENPGETAMASAVERQAIIDDEHLKLLSLGYVISGVMSGFMSLFGLLYAGVGAMFLAIPASDGAGQAGEAPPEAISWIFGLIGIGMFVLLLGLAIAKFRTASLLKQRRSKTFCMVVAALTCFGIPWGTAIGALTFMVLGRDSVSRQFDVATAA